MLSAEHFNIINWHLGNGLSAFNARSGGRENFDTALASLSAYNNIDLFTTKYESNHFDDLFTPLLAENNINSAEFNRRNIEILSNIKSFHLGTYNSGIDAKFNNSDQLIILLANLDAIFRFEIAHDIYQASGSFHDEKNLWGNFTHNTKLFKEKTREFLAKVMKNKFSIDEIAGIIRVKADYLGNELVESFKWDPAEKETELFQTLKKANTIEKWNEFIHKPSLVS